ncbi:hypothetical protein BDK51DRAFT_33312 [Blyttiomyces helicus]|uniref:MARVEL domain-containing protein n=1 Tax=Blyttiomyces helicus TaxID=388810 RepID=A0A4P9W1X8_9FUNG|nr:hypothetical protein BDK51DRAFT_33312 [Blyttiomyces helicus]|eukprot:RKO85173.1 hypothetical protein BDK51DRAFT_33312 [Blyttiomyces helicus]
MSESTPLLAGSQSTEQTVLEIESAHEGVATLSASSKSDDEYLIIKATFSKTALVLALVFFALAVSESVLIGGIAGGATGRPATRFFCGLFPKRSGDSATCAVAITFGSIGLASVLAIGSYLCFAGYRNLAVSTEFRKGFAFTAAVNSVLSLSAFGIVIAGISDGKLSDHVNVHAVRAAAAFAIFAWLEWACVAYTQYLKFRQ